MWKVPLKNVILKNLKCPFLRKVVLSFRFYFTSKYLPAYALYHFFEFAEDKFSKELKIRKFCCEWRKIEVSKCDHVESESHFFCTLERSNFAASAFFEVNFFDFKIRYQMLQVAKKWKKSERSRCKLVRFGVAYIYIYTYLYIIYIYI